MAETDQQSTRRTMRRSVILLILLGLAALGVRSLHEPGELPGGDTAWQLNMRVDLIAAGPQTQLRLSPPWDTQHARVYRQELTHPGFTIRRKRSAERETREIFATAQRPGDIYLDAVFHVHLSTAPLWQTVRPPVALTAEGRESFLASEEGIKLDDAVIMTTLDKVLHGEADPAVQVRLIFDYVRKKLALAARTGINDASQVLRKRRGNTLGRARAMVALCRGARIPARVITGFRLAENFNAQPFYWVEVHDDTRWVAYDPEFGYVQDLPANYLPVRRRAGPIVQAIEASDVITAFEISEQKLPPDLAGQTKRWFDVLNLTRLPLETRMLLAALLLMPLGALATAVARNIVGIRTYGTFTPTLLALAALHADWITTAVIFSVVAVLGIVGRSLMPGLKLARAPRLSIVFTLVGILMALSISLMDYHNLVTAGLVTLLPIVVLTSLIDRVYTVADDDGLRIAVVRLAWTLAVAGVCMLILRLETLGFLLLSYPELHLFTIAVIVLTSLYTGPKLSDLPGAHWITEPKRPRRTRTKAAPADAGADEPAKPSGQET